MVTQKIKTSKKRLNFVLCGYSYSLNLGVVKQEKTQTPFLTQFYARKGYTFKAKSIELILSAANS